MNYSVIFAVYYQYCAGKIFQILCRLQKNLLGPNGKHLVLAIEEI